MSFHTFHWRYRYCFRKQTLWILSTKTVFGWQKNDVIKLSHAEIKWSYSVVGSNSQNKVFVFEKFLFFLQRKFPHQAALPSLETTRHLFKKHCNKVGSFTKSSSSLECSYMKYLFAFCTFVLWLCNDLCCQHGFCKPVHLYNLLTEAIQGGGQWSTILFPSFFFQPYSQALSHLCPHIILLQNTCLSSEMIFISLTLQYWKSPSRRTMASLY